MPVWTPESFLITNPETILTPVVAAVGDALCKEAVCYLNLTTGDSTLGQRQNKIILDAMQDSRLVSRFFLSTLGDEAWCYTVDFSSAKPTWQQLAPSPGSPGELRTVTLQGHPAEETKMLVATEHAMLDTIPHMARAVSNAAKPLPELPPWNLSGLSWGADESFELRPDRLLPVVGKVLQAIGEGRTPEGASVASRLALHLGSSGLGQVQARAPQEIWLSTDTGNARNDFRLSFRQGGKDERGEYAAVSCTLDRTDRTGALRVTEDRLVQHGNRLQRVHYGADNSGGRKPLRQHPANDLTILEMAQEAITGNSTPAGLHNQTRRTAKRYV